MAKRSAMPALSPTAQEALATYHLALAEREDMRPVTIRNYLSDLRQFVAWCETTWAAGQDDTPAWTPAALSTPLLTRYRTYLQLDRQLKPASINRGLISIKKYCAWCVDHELLARDPAKAVKLVGAVPPSPRHLSDPEEEALLAAVATGSLRDQTLITLMLHTGLRVGEVCRLRRQDVTLGTRSGTLRVLGKRNKYRDVPLNATARTALHAYLDAADPPTILFPSEKTGAALTERALGYLVTKYAVLARVAHVRPHDLRHRFGYRMAATVPLHRLAQLMGHDSLDTTLRYTQATAQDLQQDGTKSKLPQKLTLPHGWAIPRCIFVVLRTL